MRTILETRRLILRELCPNDFHEVCKLLQDNEVMYAYEGAFNGTEVREWLAGQLKRYADAKVRERDLLPCDENGFAQPKALHYWIYTV